MQLPDEPIRVLLVDDHELFRSGLRALLEDEGYVVADAASGAEALRRLEAQRPDVVVMDLNMPEMDGIEATRRVVDRFPDLPVLMLTVASEEDQVVAAVVAGACGYMLKDAELAEISAAVRAAASGQAAISPKVGPALLARVRAGERDAVHDGTVPGHSALDALTARERDVLRLLAQGEDNAGIAERLHLSASTVKSHVSAIFDKLGVDNRVQAATTALRGGLLDDFSA